MSDVRFLSIYSSIQALATLSNIVKTGACGVLYVTGYLAYANLLAHACRNMTIYRRLICLTRWGYSFCTVNTEMRLFKEIYVLFLC